MHVPLLVDHYNPPLGGAKITFRILLRSLQYLNTRITIVQYSQNGNNELIEKDGFHVYKVNGLNHEDNIVDHLKSDSYYRCLKECEWRFNGGTYKKLLYELKHWVKCLSR